MGQLCLVVADLYSDDIKPDSMTPILRYDVVFCCCAYKGLLVGCYKRLWMPKSVIASGFYFYKY